MTRVLVVDDDTQLLRALRINLSVRGYEVITAATGSRALAAAAEHPPHVVILDLGMPDLPGIDVLAGLRGWMTAPVIVLSARTDSADKVGALDAGADDYMTKPCYPREVATRVRTVFRRSRPSGRTSTLDFDGMHIDVAAHEILVDGLVVELTPMEFELLLCLARSPRITITRAQLLHTVWASSPEWQTGATVTEHVRRLRAKIEIAPDHPRWVVTIRGLGYRFEPRTGSECLVS